MRNDQITTKFFVQQHYLLHTIILRDKRMLFEIFIIAFLLFSAGCVCGAYYANHNRPQVNDQRGSFTTVKKAPSAAPAPAPSATPKANDEL